MADLTFAEPLNMLEGSEYSPWVKTIFASIKIASRMRVLTSIPALGKLIRLAIGKIAKQKQVSLILYTASVSLDFDLLDPLYYTIRSSVNIPELTRNRSSTQTTQMKESIVV